MIALFSLCSVFLALTACACGIAAPAAPANVMAVAPHHGKPALMLGGQPVPPFAYMSYLGKEEYYREAAEAGIHLYCFPAYLGDRGINPHSGIGPFRPALWKGPGKYDFAPLEKDFNAILGADPEARIIIRIHLDPPAWWEAAHPEGCCQLSDGSTFRQCFASPVWRADTAEAFRACLGWLDASPCRASLAGIHVAAGRTEEWFYHYHDTFRDRNPARTRAFRDWLRAKYGGDAGRLRAAWHRDDIDFDSVGPADISGAEKEKRWRTADEAPVIDTFRFHAESMADNIVFFCRLVKKSSGGKLLTGAFYGYHCYVTDPRSGHFALARLLECPDLDYLSSPNVYRRVMGEDWPPMAATASVALHGKLWLAENDTRTFRTTLLKDQAPAICPEGYYDGGVWRGPESASDSVALLRKNTARMLAGGYGGWWFDMWGGWFSDPALREVLRRTQELGALSLAESVPEMRPQIAVITDEELAFHDAAFGAATARLLDNRYALGRSGAPHDLYLRNDMTRLPPEQYRAVWLLGLRTLTPSESGLIKSWREKGITVVWTRPEGSEIRAPGGGIEQHKGKIAWKAGELREAWEKAGVHIYLDADDVLYAGSGWIGIHTLAGGERTLKLPFTARIENAFDKEALLAESAATLLLKLPPRSTTLLRIAPAEIQCGNL
jgi:beta-galactosidase